MKIYSRRLQSGSLMMVFLILCAAILTTITVAATLQANYYVPKKQGLITAENATMNRITIRDFIRANFNDLRNRYTTEAELPFSDVAHLYAGRDNKTPWGGVWKFKIKAITDSRGDFGVIVYGYSSEPPRAGTGETNDRLTGFALEQSVDTALFVGDGTTFRNLHAAYTTPDFTGTPGNLMFIAYVSRQDACNVYPVHCGTSSPSPMYCSGLPYYALGASTFGGMLKTIANQNNHKLENGGLAYSGFQVVAWGTNPNTFYDPQSTNSLSNYTQQQIDTVKYCYEQLTPPPIKYCSKAPNYRAQDPYTVPIVDAGFTVSVANPVMVVDDSQCPKIENEPNCATYGTCHLIQNSGTSSDGARGGGYAFDQQGNLTTRGDWSMVDAIEAYNRDFAGGMYNGWGNTPGLNGTVPNNNAWVGWGGSDGGGWSGNESSPSESGCGGCASE